MSVLRYNALRCMLFVTFLVAIAALAVLQN